MNALLSSTSDSTRPAWSSGSRGPTAERHVGSPRRRGLTLLHVQTTMAISSVLLTAVAMSMTGLYRLQNSLDEIRQQNTVAYQLETQFRLDARNAESVEAVDGGLVYQVGQQAIRYEIDGRRLLRLVDDQPPRLMLVAPTGVLVEFGAEPSENIATIALRSDSKDPTASSSKVIAREIRTPLGRAHLQKEEPDAE